MSRALLDVNVLIALTDADHLSHDAAHQWFDRHATEGWASCAITQNGAVRVMSQPVYSHALTTAEAAEQVAASCAGPAHEFWPCDVSLLDRGVIDRRRLLSPKQLTDIYLLALAVAHDGRFVTFDTSIDVRTVPGAASRNLAFV